MAVQARKNDSIRLVIDNETVSVKNLQDAKDLQYRVRKYLNKDSIITTEENGELALFKRDKPKVAPPTFGERLQQIFFYITYPIAYVLGEILGPIANRIEKFVKRLRN